MALQQQWVWPHVHKGYVQPVTSFGGRHNITITSLSERPRIFEVANLLSAEECDSIRRLADARMAPSYIVRPDKQTNPDGTLKLTYSDYRTSSSTFLRRDDPTVKVIGARVADLVRIPELHAELMQVIHYGVLEHYHGHFDYIPPGSDMIEGRHPYDNRLVTVLFYLNDVDAGGETVFPKTNPEFQASDSAALPCQPHYPALKIRPRKGSAVMFYNMDELYQVIGKREDMSWHGGCDVFQGEKWAANYWVHNMYWHNPPPLLPAMSDV